MVSGAPRLSAWRARAQKSATVTGSAIFAGRLIARLAVLRFVGAGIARLSRYRHAACRRRFRPGELVLGDFQIEQPSSIESQNVALGPFAQERKAGDRTRQVEIPVRPIGS